MDKKKADEKFARTLVGRGCLETQVADEKHTRTQVDGSYTYILPPEIPATAILPSNVTVELLCLLSTT